MRKSPQWKWNRGLPPWSARLRQKAGNSGKTKRAAGANGHRGAGPWLDLALCNPLMKLDPLGWPAGPGNPLPPPGLPLIYVLVSGRVAPSGLWDPSSRPPPVYPAKLSASGAGGQAARAVTVAVAVHAAGPWQAGLSVPRHGAAAAAL
ncbi:MAG: hypothetical protein BroJett010_14110 [Gammaproteobacteria bacterium]|nr:MAG: hypothetical protein BroJett010_14110 [Gammaproteobacteria bacterium]